MKGVDAVPGAGAGATSAGVFRTEESEMRGKSLDDEGEKKKKMGGRNKVA